MLTYYFRNPEDALKRAKADSKHPGCYFGGITLPSGKRGFAVYEGGEIVERYALRSKEMKQSAKQVKAIYRKITNFEWTLNHLRQHHLIFPLLFSSFKQCVFFSFVQSSL